jgi:transposase
MKNPTLSLEHKDANRERLLAIADQIPGAWIGIKIAALLLVLEGQRPGWITEVFGLTRMSLSRWIHGVNKDGLKFLKPKPRAGRTSRLAPKIQRALAEHLEKSPREFGLNRAQWDGPTVAIHLKRFFGISLKVRQAQRWMHHLGYRLKRASYSYLQARSQEAQKFQGDLKKT